MKRTWCMAMAAAVGVMAVLALPGRLQAATYTATWVGGGDNLWNNASQWNPTARYPNNDQPAAGDLYDVTFGNTANTAILNQNVTLNTLTFNGSNISNAGNTLTVNGAMTWINLSSNRPQLTGTGTLNALGGIAINLVGNGGGGAQGLRSSWVINLSGTTTLGNSIGYSLLNTGTINVQTDATLEITNTEAFALGTPVGTINVASQGTLLRSTQGALSVVNNVVNNQSGGSVEVEVGGLHLNQGGTHAGSFTVASGSLLQLSGTHTFNSGATVGGEGNVSFGYVNPSNVHFPATATFNSGATFAPDGNVAIGANGTVVTFAATTSIPGSVTAINNFQLNGDGDVNIAGKFNWQLSAGGGGSSLNGTGVLNALGGMEITGFFARTNNKTLNLYGDSSIDFTSDFYMTNNGTINVLPAATLELKASGGGTDTIRDTGTINNQGTFFRAQGNERRIQNTLNNTGTVRVDAGGRFDFTGPVTQLSGTTLTGGTWHANGGTMNLPGGNLTTIGAGATVILEIGGVINRIGTSLATVQGTLEVNGMTFTPAPTITVDTTGTLGGSGTISANVVNAGLVGPGQSPGIFTVTGDFTQTATGLLLIELAGYTQGGEYDLLSVGGAATLAGGLEIVLLDGFYPPRNSTFDVLTASSLTADGFGLVGPNASLFSWGIVDGTTLRLTSQIPEPTSLALLGLAGLAAWRRRR